MLPHLGYRVRTLHGLAHDIVRERPGLVGLADEFHIVDEREANAIRADVARAWLRGHPDRWSDTWTRSWKRTAWRGCGARSCPSWCRTLPWPSSAPPRTSG